MKKDLTEEQKQNQKKMGHIEMFQKYKQQAEDLMFEENE